MFNFVIESCDEVNIKTNYTQRVAMSNCIYSYNNTLTVWLNYIKEN